MTLLTTLSHAADTAQSQPAAAAPRSGVDVQYIDAGVRAQDDFFAHLNGQWLKTTEIPADKSSWGSFAKLRDDTLPQLRAIVEAAQQAGQGSGAKAGAAAAEQQKIGDLYASYMDEKRLDALGAKPLAGEFSRIRALRDKKAIPALVAHLAQIGVAAPYAIYIGQDARASTRYAVYVGQSGLGMPDRDYYLDAKLAEVKTKYQLHVEKMLALAGGKRAGADAKAVVALETALAQVQWTKVENRDPVKRYNKVALAQLDALTPGYDLRGGMAAAGVAAKVDYVIASQPSYLGALQKIVEQTDLATWQAYFEWQLLRSYAPYLSSDFADAHFAFYGTTITGVTAQPPRWKRGVAAVEGALGEAVGKLYVARHFPAERKARMETLVRNLMLAYRQSIDTLEWMSPETKREAQAKLAKFTPKIGYPSKWRDYGALAIARGELVGNMMRAADFGYKRQLNKLGMPVDREEWGMTPQTVNAYYSSTMNEIVFPASILQPPFFDAGADDAVNYGAIGAVIGHEISHGFDDKGSQSDGDGNLRDWWGAQDRKNFAAKTDALVRQYSRYSPLPGYQVNGELTLGENIADNSGLAVAYKAYRLSLGGQEAPVIDGLSGDQRFYMGFGQVWRSKMREPQQIVQIKSDPHSPGQFRANGTVVNQPGFYDAFDVKEGDKMYLAPEQRVIIW
ncbi:MULTISPECIES: M13 family metallopeptidase [unclassified Janthinobacterium]|uniref:M13 family metallopeptidase n=1 Tax=unclassified Janthinobacterium TaxID=2610881 RepID=UPI0003456F62|nr:MULTISPECIES: M13 family metallopeptidase [unclassified Janthinobacterium]MEC5159882.1 putative endopeptidase [Janthinobacterium sp. CG_S6]